MMLDLDDENINSYDLSSPLTKEKKGLSPNLKLLLFLIFLNAILIGIVTFGIYRLYDDEDEDEDDLLKVLKKDEDFIKPNYTVNLEFELVQLKNNMKGLIISDPHSFINHAQFQVENGYLSDETNGIAHLVEHMIFTGSEKYSNIYPYDRTLGGTFYFYTNAYTADTYQVYFVSSINNYKNNQGIDIMLDALRHPLYDKDVVKKEIQPINSEFYEGYREQSFLMEDIVRLLSSSKTSFNGMGCGNNETLNPDESESISKKLKQYHMIVNRPEKIFFSFYSNLTIKQSEDYIKKHYNYKMYEFPKEELDSQFKAKFENIIKDLESTELFDDSLYKHGVYYNSNIKSNLLHIFFHIGDVDYKDIQFDLLEYYDYLFFSESLLKILKEKNFMTRYNRLGVFTHTLIKNNNVMVIEFYLSDNGLKNLEEVLTIIYKYIDIMKNEGYKREYFENYINYKNNINAANFKKYAVVGDLGNTMYHMTQNYRLYGDEQIFLTGTPSMDKYNEFTLKHYLSHIKYEKSFFLLNIKETIKNSDSITTFLKSKSIKTLKYYNINVLVGEIPTDFEESINNKNKNYENLEMREINPYLSAKLERVTPCYKISPNKCKELDEFDLTKEDKYNATLLEESNKNYVTYYQIDKSSESHLVNAYLKFQIQKNELFNDDVYNNILYYYFITKLLFVNEVDSIFVADLYNTTISFEIQCFSDNIEKVFEKFIDYFLEEPKEFEFEYILNSFKNGNNAQEMPLFDYSLSTSDIFVDGGENKYDSYSEDFYKKLNNATFDQFKEMYNNITSTITSMKLKIAGHIDKDLVQNLHNIVKDKIEIIPQDFKIFKEETEVNNETSFVINYYTKCNLTSTIDNSILMRYKYDKKYEKYLYVFMGCLDNIAMIYLRFNYSHSYSPRIFIYVNEKQENFLVIYEQGRYKEVTDMEYEINEVIKGMLNGTIQCENYKDIVESYKIKEVRYYEKVYENSYADFFYGDYGEEEMEEKDQKEEEEHMEEQEQEQEQKEGEQGEKEEEVKYPDTFKEFIDELSPIFTNPQKITVLMARSDMPDVDFKKMVENRNKTNEEYYLNSSITIVHTDDIYYMKNRTFG